MLRTFFENIIWKFCSILYTQIFSRASTHWWYEHLVTATKTLLFTMQFAFYLQRFIRINYPLSQKRKS